VIAATRTAPPATAWSQDRAFAKVDLQLRTKAPK
jgi:hypothetical protein